LQGYISKGLQNNLDIRIAMQNIVAAQATMKQGKAGYFLVYLWERTGRIKCCLKQSVWSIPSRSGTDQYQLAGSLSWADIWGK
jgi:outer membrane protein TolC